MSLKSTSRDTIPLYAALVGAVGVVGLAGAYSLPRNHAEQMSAFFGVASATFSGVFALSLKRWAMSRALKWALGTIVAVFFLRLLLVSAGLIAIRGRPGSITAFVIGFFCVYFVLQWLEISYVMVESKRRNRGVE